jgi:endonuclease G
MEKLSPDQDYRSRGGYRADFIDGFTVALPELSKRQKERAARNQQAARRANPFELKYRHFSVVMNAERKLAFFTACNIDGATAKSVNRTTGKVTPAKPGEAEAMEAAEASEAWFEDPRIAKSEQTPQKLYAGQKTYLDDGKRARDDDHLDRMFQRGHLVRRADPAWGSDDDARAADADTFHFTNCAPQVGFFNMGSADPDMPKSGGGRLWRALEDYVLANAIAEDKRVCVFTGPVFGDDDPPWRGDIVEDFRVPLSFWKIVVWSEDGTLAARAMLASQAGVLRRLPEAMREAFSDREAVADFVTSIAHVEKLTGLAFPPSVRKADQGAGERAMRRVRSREEIFGKKR